MHHCTGARWYVLLGFVERLHHRDALLPATDDILRLLEQVIQHLRLVQLLEKLALEVILRMTDESQGDGLGDHVDDLPLHNVEVGVDEKFYEMMT